MTIEELEQEHLDLKEHRFRRDMYNATAEDRADYYTLFRYHIDHFVDIFARVDGKLDLALYHQKSC